MNSQRFAAVVSQYEANCMQHLLSTEAHETKKRESIYASYTGFRDFLGLMKALVEEKRALQEKDEPALSETDALPQDID